MASIDYDSDGSSDEGLGMAMRSVLPVADFDDYDPDVPPQSGAEYLRRVQIEAKREPKIKVATNLNVILKSTVPVTNLTEDIDSDEFIRSKPEFRLSQNAICQVIERFSALRNELQELRSKHGDNAIDLRQSKSWWKEFCLDEKVEEAKEENNPEQLCYQPQLNYCTNLPQLSLLSKLDQSQIYLLLKYHCQWIAEKFTLGNGLWIYSLLVSLDTTQTGDVYSLLRQISRLCSRIRHKDEVNFDLKNDSLQRISSLNLIIVLIGYFFGQKDLIDS